MKAFAIEEEFLGHEAVSRLWKKQRKEMFASPEADLAKVTRADSSAVALLIKWAKARREQGGKLICHNTPAQLKALIKMYGATDLMDLG